MTEALKALAHLQFHYTPTGRDVWRPPRAHVDRLHPTLLDTILDGVEVAERSPDVSPVGVVVRGQKGAGKTHLLSRVRELTQLRGGYFFLVSLLDANTFWRSVAMSIVDGLNQEVDNDGTTQLHVFLHRLTDQLDLPVVTRMAVTGRAPVTVERLDAFVTAIGDRNRQVGIRCQTSPGRSPCSPAATAVNRTSRRPTCSAETRPSPGSGPPGASGPVNDYLRSWSPRFPSCSP